MSPGGPLETERLRLRRWREEDREAFASLNADPVVMEHFPSVLPRERSDLMIDVIESGFEQHGFGLWAVEQRSGECLIGMAGLATVPFFAHFTPAVEVGWRLHPSAWGHGYATEAATAALDFGFGEAGLDEIVSFTATTNERSAAVMRRLGMSHDPRDDFDHPRLPAGHALRRHVLYRISANAWRGRGEAATARSVNRGSIPRR